MRVSIRTVDSTFFARNFQARVFSFAYLKRRTESSRIASFVFSLFVAPLVNEGYDDPSAGVTHQRGSVRLTGPKLRTFPFEASIIERYRPWESSPKEALVEIYLAGVGLRRVASCYRPCDD
jgi:hypothetical protein